MASFGGMAASDSATTGGCQVARAAQPFGAVARLVVTLAGLGPTETVDATYYYH